MRPFLLQLLVLLLSTLAGLLKAGWAPLVHLFLTLHLGFLLQTWLLLTVVLLSLLYLLRELSRSRARDETPLIIGSVGAFFLFVGSFIGPIVVIVGLLTVLFSLYYQHQALIQAPELPRWK